ncbi:38191_t:CDS:1, partial [Gigaspora margarita]
MEPDLKKYITSNETKLINEILQCSKNVDDKTLQVGSKQYYKNLYEKLLKNYSSLLDDIEKNRLKIDISFYKNELKRDTDECINTYISGTKSYYKMLYEKVSILYSLLLDGISVTKLYFDYQKQHDSNSFFRLLCDLKQREDNVYNIIEAKNEFERIKLSSFSNLTSDFKNI